MNPSLALIIFPSDDEPEEQYAEKLFKIKHYFFQRSPIPKVYKQKIKELNDIHLAFEIRFPELSISKDANENLEFSSRNDFANDFIVIQEIRSMCRRNMSNSHNALSLIEILQNWYYIELKYSSAYNTFFKNHDLSDINLAQSSDPMYVMKELKNQTWTLTDDSIEEGFVPSSVVHELKRCSKFMKLYEATQE